MSLVPNPVVAGALTRAECSRCRNCGTEVNGKYCSACGEATTVHVPSAGEFLHEFIGHFIALEGKLWKTLWLLVSRPGQLTVDYLGGRRVPFVSPLRLYLTLSLVFFALIKLCGVELPHLTLDDKSMGASYSHTLPNKSAKGGLNTIFIDVKLSDTQKSKPDDRSVRDGIRDATGAVGTVNQKWMKNLKEFMSEPAEKKGEMLNHGVLAYLPYMMIGTLPFFAFYLKLIYLRSGRYYGEHLVFALHANALAFLVASVMIVVPGSALWLAIAMYERSFSIISPWDYLQCVPLLYMLAYLPVAMHRVYRGSWRATLLRWLLLVAAHLSIVAISTVLAEVIAIVGHA